MPSVLVFHDHAAAYAALLRQRGLATDVAVAHDEAEFARLLPGADVLLGFRFPPAPFAHPHRLAWIHVAASGAEFLAPLRPHLAGVTITNSRGIHGTPIAEYAIAAMVMLRSDWPGRLRAQAQRQWQRRPMRTIQGTSLGIVGLGAIGSEIARRAASFGMEVQGVSRAGRPVPGCPVVHPPDRLHAMLATCDFVAVAAPLTQETRGLLDERAFAAMKPGACLVNVSRGGVVDEQAMIRALEAGRLAGACVDVFETEPLPAESPLWVMPNVIVTPHVAGTREDYVERVIDIFAENLAAFEAGRPLRNVFDLARGY